jgi:choice-of-anchor B domain-containing protein
MRYIFVILLTCLALYTTEAQSVPEGKILSQWKDESLPSSSIHDNTYNEVWGIVHNGREYAIIGTTFGTHFIDVTDPESINEVVRIAGGTVGPEVIHRDYHDYKGYLYAVCDEGSQSTLQIIDYSYLPDSVQIVYDSKEYIRRAHNIFIDKDNDKLYAMYTAGDQTSFSPIRIFDLTDPLNPQPIAAYSSIDGVSFSSGTHDGYFINNIGYLNNGFSGLAIVDFTDSMNPSIIASLSSGDYPQPGYNHSGWLSEDGNYYYMADENHGHDMKIIDVSALPDVRVEGVFNAESSSSISIPHNQVVAGNHLYVSYYFDGLQVYDISDPKLPVRKMYYPTSSRTHQNGRYQGAWGVYPFLPSGNILVSDMQEGLFVIENVNLLSSTQEKLTEDPLNIYPNPVSSYFRISTGIDCTEVVLFDARGKLLQVWEPSDQYDINGQISNGLYIVKAGDHEEKIIINR